MSYAFQWQSCNSLGVGCLNISGATSSTRLLGASEVGGTVRVAVTASNAAGSTAGTSEATGVIVESPCTDTWTGSDEGAWQTPGNWSTGSVPGRTEVACLEAGATVQVTGGTNQVGVLKAEGASLKVTGGSLEIASTSKTSQAGTLVLSGGTLSVGGELGVSGSFAASGEAKVSGGGRLVVESGATGTVEGCQPLVLDGVTLANEGTVRTGVAGGGEHGEVRLEGGAVLQNSGTFDEDTYDNYACWERHAIEGSGSSASVVNSGTFNVEAGSGRTAEVTAAFTSTGSVDVRSGTFTLSNGGSSSGGSWVTGSGAAVAFTAGSYSLTGANAMAATVRLMSGTLTATGTSSTVGSLVLSGGTLSVGGELGVSGSFAASGEAKVSGGGRLVVESGATGTVEGCQPLVLDGVTLANEGTVRTGVAGGGEHGEVRLEGGAVLQNSGTFDEDTYDNYACWERHAIEGSGSSASVVNSGTFNVEAGSGRTAEVTAAFTSTGSVDVRSGTFTLSGGGSSSGAAWSVASGSQLTFAQGSFVTTGGSWSGGGAVNVTGGSVTASGVSGTGQTVGVAGGSLAIPSGSSMSVASLVLSGGTLSVGGEFGVSGSFAASGEAKVSGGGRLVVESGATGTVEGCQPLVLDGVTLANEGTVRTGVAGGGEHGEVRLEGGAVLQNSGTFDEDTYDNYVCWERHAIEGSGSSASVVNSGTFNVEAGSGRTAEVTAAFDNTGTVDVSSGTFTPAGGGSSSGGSWVTGSGAAVALTAGSYSLTGANAMAATVRLLSGTLTATGTSSTVGSLVLSGGTLSVVGELGVSGLLASGVEANVSGGGRLVVESGATGTVDVPGCSLLLLTGVTLVNEGTMTMGSAGGSAGQIDMSEGAQLQNAGTFDAYAHSANCVPGADNAAIQSNGGTTSITNTGTFDINPGSANTVSIQPEFENQGTLDVLSGSVRLSGGGIPEVPASGAWLGEDGPIVLSGGTFLVTRGSDFQTRVEGARVIWVARALTGYLSTLPSYVSGTVAVTGVGEPGVGETFSSATVEIVPAGSSSWKTLCGPLTPGLGGTFECSWETAAGAYPDGTYLLRAHLSSASPTESVTTASTDVQVDNTPPIGTLTVEAAHSYSGLTTLTGTASDAGSGVAAWQLEIEREGSSEWTNACPPQYLPLSGDAYGCTLETSKFANGGYRLRAVVSDRAGNTFTTPTQSFPIDNEVVSGTVAEPPTFVTKTLEAEGTASANATSWAVQIAPSGTLAWSSACPVQEKPAHGSTYSCQIDTGALADGEYEVRAIVADQQGDVYATKPVATIVDNTPPTGFLYPPPHSVTGSFEVQGYAADPVSGVGSWQVQIAPAGSETWLEACPPQSLPLYGDIYGCNVNVSELANGAYQVRAAITDNAGNVYDTPALAVTVEDVAPAVTASPTITGYAIVGHTLSASIGSWSGAQPIAYAEQWQRCTASGQSCQDVEGATGDTYVPGALDVGQTDRVAVTATNGAGSSTAYSAVSGVVRANTLGNLSPPAIDGTPAAGSTLTADPGVWSGAQPISYSYQWESCNGTGGDCAEVAGATGARYALGTGDISTTLRVTVTATDSEGSAKLTSAPSSPIVASASSSGIRYLYDRGGRLSIVDAPGQGAAIYTWDPDGNLTSIERVSASTLSVLAFSPQQAPVGASVDITGTGFDPEGSQDEVSFDGASANVTRATATDLTVEVPEGAVEGPITVTVAGRSAHSATSFTPEGGGDGPLLRRAPTQGSAAASSSRAPLAADTRRARASAAHAPRAKVTARPAGAGTALAGALASFRPRQPAAWHPGPANRRDDNWVMGPSTSPWRRLPALRARAGQTGLSGQVLLDNGMPLADVTLSIEGTTAATKSDASGRFLLTGLPAGHQVLVIDGTSASRAGARYGRFTDGVELAKGKTTPLESTIWMTPLDPAGDRVLPALTRKETVLTNPRIPGLEVRIPAGTTIRSASGAVVRHVNLTAIPIDRAPFPLPMFISGVPTYFTVQPGGAYLNKGAQIIYPNWGHLPPGQRVDFWNYDPSGRGWYIYGKGTVSANGQQVVPDANVRVWEFTGAMISSSKEGPGGPRSGEEANAGDPVDLYTGLFVYQHTDLTVPDSLMPISLTRVYRPRDHNSYSFGIGTQSAYDIHLWSDENYKAAKLVLPDGGEIELVRKSPGAGFGGAVYYAVETAGVWEGATMSWESNLSEWVLRRRDGMTFIFRRVRAAAGDRKPRRRSHHAGTRRRREGPIVEIRTPHSRGIDLTYDDYGRVIQADRQRRPERALRIRR